MNRMWMMLTGSGPGKKGDSLPSSGRKSETVPFFLDSRYDPVRQKEKGSVLIAAIFILIILAVIAASATTSSVLESRMSVNSIDKDSAFQAAGVALRGGEAAIFATTVKPPNTAGCNLAIPLTCVATLNTVNTSTTPQTGSVFANAPAATLPWRPPGTGQAAVVPGVTNAANLHAPLANPEVVVEYIGFVIDPFSSTGSGREFYRVTARGTGRNNAQVIVQSTYAKRF